MESTKKGMPLDTPNLSNYRLTGESLPTVQRYKNHSFIESLLNQIIKADRLFFYTGAIVNLSKYLKR
jgi:hypothetical protein